MRVLLAIVSVASTFLLGAAALQVQSDSAGAATNATQYEVVDTVLVSTTSAAAGPLVYIAGFAFIAVAFAFLLVAAGGGR